MEGPNPDLLLPYIKSVCSKTLGASPSWLTVSIILGSSLVD